MTVRFLVVLAMLSLSVTGAKANGSHEGRGNCGKDSAGYLSSCIPVGEVENRYRSNADGARILVGFNLGRGTLDDLYRNSDCAGLSGANREPVVFGAPPGQSLQDSTLYRMVDHARVLRVVNADTNITAQLCVVCKTDPNGRHKAQLDSYLLFVGHSNCQQPGIGQ